MRLGLRSWCVLFFLFYGGRGDVARIALLRDFALLPLQLLENLDGSVLAQSSAGNNRHVKTCSSLSYRTRSDASILIHVFTPSRIRYCLQLDVFRTFLLRVFSSLEPCAKRLLKTDGHAPSVRVIVGHTV